jgi:prepilin-type N-terminal cleavage/methylation domain-containing protein
MARRGAFTLIELLVTVGIIALLISIAMPSISAAKRISKRTNCAHNLHEIGVGFQSYLQSNHDRFPVLCEFLTAEPSLNPTNPRPPISRGMAREFGNRNKVFECPADLVTEPAPVSVAPTHPKSPGMPAPVANVQVGGRYFDVEETSYDWRVQFNGLYRHAKVVIWKDIPVPINSVAILTDFEAFHGSKTVRRARNYLYPDLRVETDKGTTNH